MFGALTQSLFCLCAQGRMKRLEGVRLEVDSRRHTVAALGAKIEAQRARLPQTRSKGEFQMEQTIRKMQHKENKLAGAPKPLESTTLLGPCGFVQLILHLLHPVLREYSRTIYTLGASCAGGACQGRARVCLLIQYFRLFADGRVCAHMAAYRQSFDGQEGLVNKQVRAIRPCSEAYMNAMG